MAKSWRWLNDTTLEMSLRQGVKWQNVPPLNGREFVADDLIYTYKYQWSKLSWWSSGYELIDRLEKVDSYTVRFSLKAPMAYFEDMLVDRLVYVAAPEPFGGKPDIATIEQNIGTGPFRVLSYTPGVLIRLTSNPDYWEGKPYLEGIDFRIMPDLSTRLAAMRGGRIDFTFERGMAEVTEELARTAPHLHSIACVDDVGYVLSIPPAYGPFQDVRVRRAISLAIDRETILKSVYLGKGALTYTAVSLFSEDYLPPEKFPPEVRKYVQYNPEEAKRLLQEAGYPKGFTVPLITTPRFPLFVRLAEVTVGMLGKVGITADLKLLSYAEFLRVVYSKEPLEGLAISFGVAADFGDVGIFNTVHSAGGHNWARVNDPELDPLLEEQRRTLDPNKRRDLVYRIQLMQPERAYYVWFPKAMKTAIASPRVQGLYWTALPLEGGDSLWNVWLSE